MTDTKTEGNGQLLQATAKIVTAYVANNAIAGADMPGLIESVHSTLQLLGEEKNSDVVVPLVPAVPVKKSVTPDYIVCLEDGKKFKSLKRHLATKFQLTPVAYRAKWNLPADYPMTAPSYSARRSALARDAGLGRKTEKVVAEATPAPAPKRKPLGLKFT